MRESAARYRAKDIDAARERSRRYAAARRADPEKREQINARRRERYETEPEYKARVDAANARACECAEFRARKAEVARSYGPKWAAQKKTDPIYLSRKAAEQRKRRICGGVRLHQAVTRRLNQTIKGKGGKRIEQMLGYSTATLRAHIEARFENGMTWENYGQVWHVDHFLPVARFPYQSETEANFSIVWALDNLWPLWAKANRRKSDAILTPAAYQALRSSTPH